MASKTKIYQDPKKLLRSIIICAAVIAAAWAAPTAARFVTDRWQDADYAEEHHAVKRLEGILEQRKANARKEGVSDDPDDPFVQGVKKELKLRRKRHAAEKKNAKCKYCEAEKE